MKRRIVGIAAGAITGFLSIQINDLINHFRGTQPFEFDVASIFLAIFGGVICYAFDNAPDERGKPKEWDREDWVDPLAEETEKKRWEE